jgi:hypothetical protein
MSQRIKGQEVSLVMTGPEGREGGIIDIQSFEANFKVELKAEGYLGETTQRYDEIFNGVEGRIELHLENDKYFEFMRRVQNRAQRRESAEGQFNIMASLNFPSDGRKRILLEDVYFGEQPVTVTSRADYVSATIEFGCSSGRFLL